MRNPLFPQFRSKKTTLFGNDAIGHKPDPDAAEQQRLIGIMIRALQADSPTTAWLKLAGQRLRDKRERDLAAMKQRRRPSLLKFDVTANPTTNPWGPSQ